jgi:tetratricopeptide (TPR) repeat protein
MNDDEKILQACRLRDEGEFLAARREFMEIAEHTEDSVTKASTLLYNIPVLAALGEFELAADHIADVARILESERKTALHTQDAEQQLRFLEVEFDLKDAYLAWAGGKNQEAANKFSRLLVKHSEEFRKPEFRLGQEIAKARYAFVLADLGRWQEDFPILKEAESFDMFQEGVAYHLGHCYLTAGDYVLAEEKLDKALHLGLPENLKYRAFCELGMTNYQLANYARAKEFLEQGAAIADKVYIQKSQI